MRILWVDSMSEWASAYASALIDEFRSAGVEVQVAYAETICAAEDELASAAGSFDLLVIEPETPLGKLDAPSYSEALPYSDGLEFLEWHDKQDDLPPLIVVSRTLVARTKDRLLQLTPYFFGKPPRLSELVRATRAIMDVRASAY